MKFFTQKRKIVLAYYGKWKGSPLSYNKDMQEDKAIYFEAYDTTTACVKILTTVTDESTVNKERLQETILHQGIKQEVLISSRSNNKNKKQRSI